MFNIAFKHPSKAIFYKSVFLLHYFCKQILLVQLKSATTLETRKGVCLQMTPRCWFTRKTKYIQLSHLHRHFFLLLVPVEITLLYVWKPQAVCPILKVPIKKCSALQCLNELFQVAFFKDGISRLIVPYKSGCPLRDS